MYNVIVVAIMALVSYIPRVLPLVFIKKQITNKFLRSFLYYIPYAVLSCLTFPAIFFIIVKKVNMFNGRGFK